ncbi:mulitfunctional nucleoside diphosphate kinase/apyrimidinic endonuclease/3'-phosphodiesterase [Mycobacterium tuberculosis EAI5/NITR206]|nr:mulitfunctional nucleoside diphosphate kinase/apyrimidinic endonuclease/3'-phosphodiesterase [Mycobacterium tuberculosis EAI5/NITR206]
MLGTVTERTLVLIKPDGIERQLIGEIISRIERKGLTIAALQLRTVSAELASQHYAEHEGKPFFGSLLEFITSGPVVAAIVEGTRAIAAVRQLCPAAPTRSGGGARHNPGRLRSRDAVQPGARV